MSSSYQQPRPPTALSMEELQEYLTHSTPHKPVKSPQKSVDLHSSPSRESYENSTAYAAAMRSLHDKIRLLEQENTMLTGKINALTGQVYYETPHNPYDHSSYRIAALDGSKRKILEQLNVKDTFIQYLENALDSKMQEHDLDRENAKIQIEQLNKALSGKTSNVKELCSTVSDLEREIKALKQETAHSKRILKHSENEVKFLRETSKSQTVKLQKTYTTLETELAKKHTEFTDKIKELRMKNRALHDISRKQSEQIEFLKRQAFNNKKEKIYPKMGRMKSMDQKPKPRPSPPYRNSTLKLPLSHPEIASLEIELASLNHHYRQLACHSPDFPDTQRELASLSQEINSKSRRLLALKQQHQQELFAATLSS